MYKHSVRIDRRKCVGCTNCIRNCHTEAIRVQNGKAKILDERCIDCGTCFMSCPHHAVVAVTTPWDVRHSFKYNIVIPSSALYSQFRQLTHIEYIYSALYSLGFDYIYEEAMAAEILSEAMSKYLRSPDAVFPIISCACPVIPRLVASLYPNLIDNLSPFVSSHELAARVARAEFCELTGVDASEVGVFYISPCAAVTTQVKSPVGIEKSAIDGVFAVRDVYAELIGIIGKSECEPRDIPYMSGALGLGSAVAGGFGSAVGTEHYLAVDGLNNIIQCLDDIDNERISGLLLLEALSCPGGCVGGPLTFENQFVAKNRNRRLSNSRPRTDFEHNEHIRKYANKDFIFNDRRYEQHNFVTLSSDVVEAMQMMDRMDEITKRLPGLDCGSCGSPSCKTLAEDIVRGYAVEMDCIFKLRDRVRQMAQEMVDLANPHSGRGECSRRDDE